MVASANAGLQEKSLKKRADGASIVELSLPAISRAGSYVLAAKLTSEVTGANGAKEVQFSPVTCSTEVVQPVKARSCRLLSLKVRGR